jgi:hypothetical protein
MEVKIQRLEEKLHTRTKQCDDNWNLFVDPDGGIEKFATELNSVASQLQIWTLQEEIQRMEIEDANSNLTDLENGTSMIPYLANSFSRN